jgi:hypothetical protein
VSHGNGADSKDGSLQMGHTILKDSFLATFVDMRLRDIPLRTLNDRLPNFLRENAIVAI